MIRRLDHVAIVVRSTDEALKFFRDRLGLEVTSTEASHAHGVRLTYLDCGNAFVQLVEPTAEGSEIDEFLRENGEGIHHVCFGVDDVREAIAVFAEDGAGEHRIGAGRGRVSAFLPGDAYHGTRIECTEFARDEDVATPGYLR